MNPRVTIIGSRRPSEIFCLITIGLFTGLFSVQAAAPWRYQLLEGSTILNDCLVCDRLSIPKSLRGSFDLVLEQSNPIDTTYSLTNIQWQTGDWPTGGYRLEGYGQWIVGGEVAVRQEMTLQITLYSAEGATNKIFTNITASVTRQAPMLQIDLAQTNENLMEFFTLNLRAAPIRELWFSTGSGLTAGIWKDPTNHVSRSDILSMDGHIVKTGQSLFGRLGIMPMVPDLGLDALDIGPGAEVFYSINDDVFSETLGPLHPGDLLSSQGRLVKRNKDLTTAFGFKDPVPDLGLDAIQLRPNGEIWFSITTNAVSPVAGAIGPGDILSTTGIIIKTNRDLLSHFQPDKPNFDYGLAALYVWPSGEIWFATENGFLDNALGAIPRGTLLSDQGYIVYRNLELVGTFQPLEDLADFGLDAVFIVTDLTPAPPQTKIAEILPTTESHPLALRWTGDAKVFQVESTQSIPGAFLPASPCLLDFEWSDSAAPQPQRYYRLHAW
jgi:hypothetical protein